MICYFDINFLEFLLYLGFKFLIRYLVLKYFLPFSMLALHFIDDFLYCAETFEFDVVPLAYFSMLLFLFVSNPKNHYQYYGGFDGNLFL